MKQTQQMAKPLDLIDLTPDERYAMCIQAERQTHRGIPASEALTEMVWQRIAQKVREAGAVRPDLLSDKACSGECPFGIGSGLDHGCLPGGDRLIAEKVMFGNNWACHAKPWKLCAGFAQAAARIGQSASHGALYNEQGKVTEGGEVAEFKLGAEEIASGAAFEGTAFEEITAGNPERIARRMLAAMPYSKQAIIVKTSGEQATLHAYRRA